MKRSLVWLERRGTKKGRDGTARYGLVASKVYGVSVGEIRRLAKTLGKDHALAASDDATSRRVGKDALRTTVR